MRRLALAVSLALLAAQAACASHRPGPQAPQAPPAADQPAVAEDMSQETDNPAPSRPPPTLAQALAAVDATARAAGLLGHGGSPLAERARAAKLDQAAMLRLLDDVVAACPSAERCPGLRSHDGLARLLGTLAAVGTVDAAPTLLRLEGRGVYRAGPALEELQTRAMAGALPGARCVPPDAAKIAATRAGLGDFLVVRGRGGRAVARAPSPGELDDLAYFLAAVADNGPEVGGASEASEGSGFKRSAADPQRDRLAAATRAATTDGDVAAIVRNGEAYLQQLGFPGPLDGAAEDRWTWGGARYSHVLRDIARARELLGEHALAGALYRRAEPGGGLCGTSVSSRWAEQVRGAIRSAERSGDCKAAIAERLIDVDGPLRAWSDLPEAADYGPARLTRAGFDVPRLYRGALVTAGRDQEPGALRAALERAPEPLRRAALARLQARGAEAWERRVEAVHGLADLAGRAALPVLTALLRESPGQLRPRVLRAIGALAARPDPDPCDPDPGFGTMSGSSEWERHITPLGERCETSLRLHEAGPLALSLAPWLKDPVPETREAAAAAIGEIGHRDGLRALRQVAGDGHRTGTICQDSVCRPHYPVREAARAARERIEERSRDDAGWKRRDPPR